MYFLWLFPGIWWVLPGGIAHQFTADWAPEFEVFLYGVHRNWPIFAFAFTHRYHRTTGVNLVLFSTSIFVLTSRTEGLPNRPLLASTFAMLILSTTNVCLSIYSLFGVCFEGKRPPLFVEQSKHALYLVNKWVSFHVNLNVNRWCEVDRDSVVADAVLVSVGSCWDILETHRGHSDISLLRRLVSFKTNYSGSLHLTFGRYQWVVSPPLFFTFFHQYAVL